MSTSPDLNKQIHQGRNIKRFREMLGWKQDALAIALGSDWTQKRVSLMEGRETIEDDILRQVSDILKVPVEAIKNLDEEKAVNIIANTFSGEASAFAQYYKCQINPMEKWLEALEEIKKLNQENRSLYERIIQLMEDKK